MKLNKSYCFLTFLSTFLVFQNCTKEKADYENANGKRGGMMYDTFWATETGYSQADEGQINKFKAHAEFYKCQSCHGWDFEGTKGAYINRVGTRLRPNVSSISLTTVIQNSTSDALFDMIKKGKSPALRRSLMADVSTYDPISNNKIGDQMPNYAEILSDAQIWDIVKFLKAEAVNPKDLYDYTTAGIYPTGKVIFSNIGKGGIATSGRQLFTTKGCGRATCHGTNGTTLLLNDGEYTLGGFVRAKPFEAHHKIKYGQLGSPMTAFNTTIHELKDIYKALSDSLAFPSKQ